MSSRNTVLDSRSPFYLNSFGGLSPVVVRLGQLIITLDNSMLFGCYTNVIFRGWVLALKLPELSSWVLSFILRQVRTCFLNNWRPESVTDAHTDITQVWNSSNHEKFSTLAGFEPAHEKGKNIWQVLCTLTIRAFMLSVAGILRVDREGLRR